MSRPPSPDNKVLARMAENWVSNGCTESTRALAEKYRNDFPLGMADDLLRKAREGCQNSPIRLDGTVSTEDAAKSLPRTERERLNKSFESASKRIQRKFRFWKVSGRALSVGVYFEVRAITYRLQNERDFNESNSAQVQAVEQLALRLRIEVAECERRFREGVKVLQEILPEDLPPNLLNFE